MSSVGGIGPTMPPESIRKADKDGSGGSGARYMPGQRRHQQQQGEDQADLSEEAKEAIARAKAMEAADGNPADNNFRLHILTEINEFNEHHNKAGSRLKAVLRPLRIGSKLVIEDPTQGVTIQPFGEVDVFQLAPQTVRVKLLSFDRSSGAIFDGRV